MKIAVITFSDFNTNYGSMLQAFAMKYYLEELGHNVTFIRYREFNKPEYQGIKDFYISNLKKFVISAYRLTKIDDICRSKENFETFKEQYLKHTSLCVTSEDFAKLPEFDCYICGSDQIWNINCLGGLRKPYFLSFAPEGKRKIAYAASMGDYIIQTKYETEISELLERLDFISVREIESISQLQHLTSKPIYNVVDPVFLLSKQEWDAVSGSRIIEGDYGVCYLVRRSKLCEQLINRLSKEYQIPIINLSDNQIYIRGTVSRYISSGPMEFVSLVKHAKFTVGTSFHLAAFSTIFGVPFLIAGLEHNKSRIGNLLCKKKKKKNYITELTEFNRKKLLYKPDKEFLVNSINDSKSFLNNALYEKSGGKQYE